MMAETELKRWKEILNWNKLPNFGNCHEIDDLEEFSKHYFLTPDLQKTIDNIILSLEDGAREQLNRIIIGQPGCGKTSFVHYLKMQSSNGHKLLEKFYFHIFDINRANLPSYKESIATEMALAWKEYFEKCGRKNISARIEQQKINDRLKCDRYEKYYDTHKSEFSKIFVFILDETDTLEEKMVKEISRELISIVSTKEIKKWLMIRQATIKSYSSDTHDIFESFFPNQTNFLGADMWDVIDFRIKKTSDSDSPKNPFSKKLAINILQKVFGGNIRAALGSLESILKYSTGNIENYTAEEFIQNFVEKSAFPALLRLTHIPNIYSPRFIFSQYPIAIDVLLLSQFGRDMERIKRVLNEISTERARQKRIIPLRDYERQIRIPTDEFNAAVNVLVDAGLMTKPRRSDLCITKMGSFIAQNILKESYLDACLRENARNDFSIKGQRLDLFATTIDHQSFMLLDYVT